MLDSGEYLRTIGELRTKYTPQSLLGDATKSADEVRVFANSLEFASANLRHLLPQIPLKQHEAVLTEALFSKGCAELDESNGFVLGHATVHDPGGWLVAARERPVIFCSFHYGSYRLINYLLARADLKFAVLASQDIWKTKRERFLGYHREAQAHFSRSATRMEVVNVEAPAGALSLARKVRSGWSLLAYLDGDNGVLGVGRHDSKMLRTTLLGQPLFARKGVAFLSHFLQAPIVPVICKISGAIEREIVVHEPVYPMQASENRETYCQKVAGRLYALLGEYLKDDPGQWERWFDIQTALDTDAIAANRSEDETAEESDLPEGDISGFALVFNRDRFGFVTHAGQQALLDKDTYGLLSLPPAIVAVLESFRRPRAISDACLSAGEFDVLRELVARQMLLRLPA